MTREMTPQRRAIERRALVANVPLQAAERDALLNDLDSMVVETDGGEMALTVQGGQLRLHYAFDTSERMKLAFWPMWRPLHAQLPAYGQPYVAIDLVQIPNRRWIEPLLEEADYERFGEWIEMEHIEVRELAPPVFPDGTRMRKAKKADHRRIIALASDAYDEYAAGDYALKSWLESADWAGVLEEDGAIVAYAITSKAAGGVARVLSCGVDPGARGRGLGALVLQAAAYQIAHQGARKAILRVYPASPRAVETATSVGFEAGRRGIEWRRLVDEAEIARRKEERRVTGMKVRFGKWR